MIAVSEALNDTLRLSLSSIESFVSLSLSYVISRMVPNVSFET